MSPLETLGGDAPYAGVEPRLLEVTGELLRELGVPALVPSLDHALERDLGIGSLERVELFLRLERAFRVQLPESAMANANTLRDMSAAILAAQPRAPRPLPARHEPSVSGIRPPASAATLVDVLSWHAEHTPDRVHIRLLDDEREHPIEYGELATSARRIAVGLERLGVSRGDRVALMLRTEPAFFPAFFGILLAGAVPVPMYPPFRPDQIEEYARRQRAILANSGTRVLVIFPEAQRVVRLLRGVVTSLEHVVAVEQLDDAGAEVSRRSEPEDPALIQYTSGSTGNPRGVLLTHANLLANIRAFGEALAIRPEDVAVSWLPLYHDMGLIGSWLGSLYHGIPLVLLSPLSFLSRPSRWLSAIHVHGGTVSAAPNFAFDLCVHKVADDEIQGLDLRSWRLALNGSEAVSADTIDRFASRFGPYGFRAEAMCPVYGLAEASVALTVPPLGRAPRVDWVAREPFARRRTIHPAAPGDPPAIRFVSCGRALPAHAVRIVDASDRRVEDRIEGHVQFRGPSVTSGYFNDPAATRAACRDGWMDSGDLGYQADGELFITGRVKDIIIQAGRNLSAQEIEEAAAGAPGVRKGCIAAFGVHDAARGTERLIVVAETRERDRTRWESLRTAVRDRVIEAIGVPPDVVVITRPGAVLKTPSGKIRHAAIRDSYLAHTLGRRRPQAVQLIRLFVSDTRDRASRVGDWCGRLAFTTYVLAVVLPTLAALWAYLAITPAGARADRAVKRWSRLALGMCGLQPHVAGVEDLEGLHAAVLVANHASYIDSVVLMAAIPIDFRFIAKRRLADYPLIGTVIRKAGHVTVEKSTVVQQLSGADALAECLRRGTRVAVFPEGTFVGRPGLLPFRLGAFRAAVDAGCPIVPIALRGTRNVLPDNAVLARRGRLDVVIGPPLRPEANHWQEMVRLREVARSFIASESGEPGRSS